MKKAFSLLLLLPAIKAFSQDTTKKVEPMKPSTSNYDLLLIAAIGLVVLIALYFLFRKTRKRQD